MLDTHQFFENLNEIQNKIYNSFFLKEVDRANLSPNEKAQLDIKIFEIACNNALRLQEMMQREKELEFSLYQKRVELRNKCYKGKGRSYKGIK